MTNYYNDVAEPIIIDLFVKYSMSSKNVMSKKNLFRGEEIVIVGKLENPCEGPKPNITGNRSDELNNIEIISRVSKHFYPKN